MSQENLDLLRSLHAAWERGASRANERGLAATLADFYDEDAILYGLPNWPEGAGPWRGRTAILGQWRRIEEDVAQQEMSIEEVVPHEDWVVVRFSWRTRSRHDLPGEMTVTQAVRLRDGKFVEHRFFWNHAEALKAVGLEE